MFISNVCSVGGRFKGVNYSGYLKWKNWEGSRFGYYTRNDHYYYRLLISKFVQNPSVSTLEIGFGNGGFAGWIAEEMPGVNWRGIEIQGELIDAALEKGFDVADNLGTFSTINFDAVFGFDVLEHLTDQQLVDLLSSLHSMVTKNGVVVFRVPNASGPLGLTNQVGDPTHLTPLSLSRISALAPDWNWTAEGDLRPLWRGKISSFFRDLIRFGIAKGIAGVIRFAFAPQPKTLFAANIHLIGRL